MIYNKNNNKKGGGCLSWFLGTVLVIIGVFAYAVLSSLLNRWLIGARFGDDAACALLPLSIVGLTVAFVLYEAIFIVKLIKFGNDKDDAKAKKVAHIVAAACISLSFVFAIVSANTFTKLESDSISKVCFFETKKYEWSDRCDVLKYSLSCTTEGALSFTVTMKDGEAIEILGQVNSCSKAFTDQYNDLYGYAAYLSEQFDSSDFIIEKSVTGVENMEKLYKDTNSEIWQSLEKIID